MLKPSTKVSKCIKKTSSRLQAAGVLKLLGGETDVMEKSQPPSGGWCVETRCASGCPTTESGPSRLQAAGVLKQQSHHHLHSIRRQPPSGGWCVETRPKLLKPRPHLPSRLQAAGVLKHPSRPVRQRIAQSQPPSGGCVLKQARPA